MHPDFVFTFFNGIVPQRILYNGNAKAGQRDCQNKNLAVWNKMSPAGKNSYGNSKTYFIRQGAYAKAESE